MHPRPDVGYPPETAAVCTLDMIPHRHVPIQKRPKPMTPAQSALQAKGYKPLPPLSPQAAAQAAAAAAAYANISGQPQADPYYGDSSQGAIPAGFVPNRQ